jgi:predicted RNA-binding Zn-ribbon protein involved in translation (DUF1610 family)
VPVPPRALEALTLKSSRHEEAAIRGYVESQARRQRVTYLEKVKTEALRDRRMDVWDVHTNRERYWVITNPTNLYRQRDFSSLDFLLSFHVGLVTRMMAKRTGTADERQLDRLAPAWRRWQQAADGLDRADEADEFQAVGMRCRECLLSLARGIARPTMVPAGEDAPKAADFVRWSELIADTIAAGSSVSEMRAYLKGLAKTTWQLVAWLTHARNAVRFDGDMAVEATLNTLTAYGLAVMRHERATPYRCPKCGSYRMTSVDMPELDPPYVTLCETCRWTDPDMGPDPSASQKRGRPRPTAKRA